MPAIGKWVGAPKRGGCASYWQVGGAAEKGSGIQKTVLAACIEFECVKKQCVFDELASSRGEGCTAAKKRLVLGRFSIAKTRVEFS